MRPQPILIYTVSFLVLALFFNIVGIINLDNYEILAYTFIFYGLATVYLSMGNNKKLQVFLGSAVFLIGIDFMVISNFDIFNSSGIIFPSTLLILGISSLILYLDNTEDRAIFFVSLIFILFGLIYSISVGSLGVISFLKSLIALVKDYWIVPVIAFIVFVLLGRKAGQ